MPISCTLKQWCRGEHIQLLIAYTIDSMITRPKANAKMQKPTPSRQTLKDGPICTGISCEKFTQPFEEILTTQYPTVSEILSTRHILQFQKYWQPDISYSLRNIENPTYPTVSEISKTQHILQSQKYWQPNISYSLRNIDNPTYPTVSEILMTQTYPTVWCDFTISLCNTGCSTTQTAAILANSMNGIETNIL